MFLSLVGDIIRWEFLSAFVSSVDTGDKCLNYTLLSNTFTLKVSTMGLNVAGADVLEVRMTLDVINLIDVTNVINTISLIDVVDMIEVIEVYLVWSMLLVWLGVNLTLTNDTIDVIEVLN